MSASQEYLSRLRKQGGSYIGGGVVGGGVVGGAKTKNTNIKVVRIDTRTGLEVVPAERSVAQQAWFDKTAEEKAKVVAANRVKADGLAAENKKFAEQVRAALMADGRKIPGPKPAMTQEQRLVRKGLAESNPWYRYVNANRGGMSYMDAVKDTGIQAGYYQQLSAADKAKYDARKKAAAKRKLPK